MDKHKKELRKIYRLDEQGVRTEIDFSELRHGDRFKIVDPPCVLMPYIDDIANRVVRIAEGNPFIDEKTGLETICTRRLEFEY